MRLALACALGAVLFTAAASGGYTEPLTCHRPQHAKQIAELLFGRNIGRKLGVSEAAWGRFVAREIASRFPDGLTITEAVGQSRDPADGTIVREPAKGVEIVLPGNKDDEARLEAIVAAYKREFRQRSVMVIVRSACVAF